MKQKTIAALSLLMFMAAAFPVSAQVPDPAPVRNDRDLEVKMKLDARRASSTDMRASSTIRNEERKASSTAKRIELQQGIAKRRAEQTSKVLLATIERLDKLTARLESRIAKVEAAGGNASTSKAYVAEAKTHLSAARVSLEAFSSIDLSGLKANENFERVKAAAKAVKEHIKAAHRSLVNATLSLKPGRSMERSTSTNATSTSN
jgi:hypothetical protein